MRILDWKEIGYCSKKFINGFRMPTGQKDQKGAILIAIILTMTIFAILGGGMLYLTTSASYAELFTNNRQKAYYMALSGVEYAAPIIQAANDASQTAPITNLDNQTFTFTNGSKFYLRTDNSNSAYTVLESTGTVNENTFLQTKQKLVFRIAKPFTYNTVADSPGFQDQTTFETNWDSVGDDTNKITVDPRDGLQFQGKENLIALDWSGNSNLPDLAAMRTNNNGLLSYKVQAKFNMHVDQGTNGNVYLAGLSFRLNIDNDTQYGLSFFKNREDRPSQIPDWVENGNAGDLLDSSWDSMWYTSSTRIYLVLWEKTSSTAQYHVIASKLLTNGSFPTVIRSDGELQEWATIAVDIQEKFVNSGPARTNFITAYINGPSDYPRGTTNFDFTGANFIKITWDAYPGATAWATDSPYVIDAAVVPTTANGHNYLCLQAGTSGLTEPTWPTTTAATVTDGNALTGVVWKESTAILDNSLTTETFNNPSEIGIHTHYDQGSNEKQYIDDFNMQGSSSNSSSGGVSGGIAY